ncbi:O-methyltransferase [Rhizodiscina lignyota]|uniref:O-methyltransferase n=1 Tax=Rhizodiscina lignyota TaxID=1504668 RepID=A0A9P4IMG9_9PEZI|nr:O-methyltransferase [Rhizodiscina lignyota]
MSNSSQLLALASAIQTQVTAIHEHLASSGQAGPSFNGQSPETNYAGIDDIRAATLESLTRLHDLLSTPREILQHRSPTDFLSRHALDRLGIYDVIPVNETRTYEQLSATTKQPVRTLRRILRHAMTQHIFYEPQSGVVAHTQVSRLLTENSKIRDYYGTVCQEVWPAATRTVDALEKWPGSTQREESGYVLATGKPLQQVLDENPAKHKRYDNAMGSFANDRTFSFEHVIKGFDWASLGSATVVDVGGGVGTVSKALAKAYPKLNFIVEDQPDVVANAAVEEEEIKERIKFIEHDFFTEQPVDNADVYFIRRVFMEWPDDKAVLILRALLPAMKKGARVLIQDFYVPEPGACPLWQERRFRASDLLALALENAGQREFEDWRALFETAGPDFQFKGVTPVPNSDVVFIEAVARG